MLLHSSPDSPCLIDGRDAKNLDGPDSEGVAIGLECVSAILFVGFLGFFVIADLEGGRIERVFFSIPKVKRVSDEEKTLTGRRCARTKEA